MSITMKLHFYNRGFYVFHEFMHVLRGSGQMPVRVMLNFNGLYVFATLHFPWFCTLFSNSGYESVPEFMFCSLILTIFLPETTALLLC
jgi:hypothetical protein